MAICALLGTSGLLVACGVTRESAVEDLVDAGYEAESAECIMSSIENQGFEASDLADPIEADVEAAIGVAVEECITAADLAGLGDNVGEEQMRSDVILNLVNGGMAADEAECIVQGVEDEGYSMVDLAQAGLEEQTEGGVIEALQAATLTCTTG
ncbi:MAG: hypothetical protein ACR2QK_23685 [Acidimicrobiales bacterium]